MWREAVFSFCKDISLFDVPCVHLQTGPFQPSSHNYTCDINFIIELLFISVLCFNIENVPHCISVVYYCIPYPAGTEHDYSLPPV